MPSTHVYLYIYIYIEVYTYMYILCNLRTDECFNYETAMNFLLVGARAIQVSAASALRPSHVGKSMTTSASASPAFFALVGSCLLSGKLVSCVKYSERTPRHLGFVWIYWFMYVYIYKYKICQRSCVCLLTDYLECAAAWDYLESLAALGCLEILSFFAEPEVRELSLGCLGILSFLGAPGVRGVIC